jgi:hypothetical protein
MTRNRAVRQPQRHAPRHITPPSRLMLLNLTRPSNIFVCSPRPGYIPGLVHYDDVQGDAARLTAAQRFARVGGVATKFGMARGDPVRLPALLARNRRLARRFGPPGFCRDVVDDRRRSWTGTDGSNPCSSSGESCANRCDGPAFSVGVHDGPRSRKWAESIDKRPASRKTLARQCAVLASAGDPLPLCLS